MDRKEGLKEIFIENDNDRIRTRQRVQPLKIGAAHWRTGRLPQFGVVRRELLTHATVQCAAGGVNAALECVRRELLPQ